MTTQKTSGQNKVPEKKVFNITAEGVVGVVSGYSALKRTAGVIKVAANSVKGLKKAVTESELDDVSQHRLRDIHDGKVDGKKSRYTIYSHTKKMIFHGDDFGACLRDAYTQTEISRMESDARLMRRIHAYGAAVVYLSAILVSLKMHSAIPLFSLFPAATLLAFALRRGCYEETMRQQKLIPYQEYLSQRGLRALWK